MSLSQEMVDRIFAIAKRRHDDHKANPTPRQPGNSFADPIGALLLEFLNGAETDGCAENLIRLLEDWEANGDAGAIAEVLSGRVDLVDLICRERED